MEEGRITLLEWAQHQLLANDRHGLRQMLVGELERLLAVIERAIQQPSLLRAGAATAILEEILKVLEDLDAGVGVSELTLPRFVLEPLPTIITQEIGRPPEADEPEKGTPLSVLGLSPRVEHAIYNARFARRDSDGLKVVFVEDLVRAYNERGEDGLLVIRNFGQEALEETLTALRAKGFLPLEVERVTARGG